MWVLADTASSAMFLLGVALLIAVLLRRSYRYQRRRKGSESSPARGASGKKRRSQGLVDAPPEVVRWQVAMHETARELKAELDSKMGAIQVLVRMARQESERLESLLNGSAPSGSAPQSGPAASVEPVGSTSGDAAEDDPSRSESRVDPAGWSGPAGAARDRRLAIYRLADLGESSHSIAESVGAPVGDVEFILSLRATDQ